jgi:hypothetical protein
MFIASECRVMSQLKLYLSSGFQMPKKLLPERTADFIESMECLSVAEVPEGPEWTYELLCGGPHKISSVVPSIMWRCHSNMAF